MPDGDTDERYDVVLTGSLLPGFETDAVVRAIAELYQVDQARIRRWLAAAPRACRRNLSRSRAERNARALRRAGAVATVEQSAGPLPTPDQPSGAGRDSSTHMTATPHEQAPKQGDAEDTNGAELFDVILTGKLAQGLELEPVVAAIASRYRIGEERVQRLLSKAPRTWKSSLSGARAEQHAKALRQAGAMAIVARQKDSAPEPGTELLVETVLLPDAALADAQGPAQIPASPSPTSPRSESAQESATADTPDRPSEQEPDADSAQTAASARPSAETALDQAPMPPAPGSSRKGAWRWGTSGLLLGLALGIATGWWAASFSDDTAVAVAGDQTDPSAPKAAGAATAEETDKATRAEGPMGLAQSSPASALDLADGDDGQGDLEPGMKRLASVPRPLPGFRRFAARVTDDTGLCGIEAEGAPVPTSDDGAALQEAFSGIEAMLDRHYGSIHRTSIRLSRNTDAQDTSWMQQLMDGDRRLSSTWSAVADQSLADSLQRIHLSAIATTDTSGVLTVEYRFNNFADCMK